MSSSDEFCPAFERSGGRKVLYVVPVTVDTFARAQHRICNEMTQCLRERIDVTYFHGATALCRFNNACDFPSRISDEHDRAGGSEDGVEPARDDESLERRQQAHPMHVRCRETIGERLAG